MKEDSWFRLQVLHLPLNQLSSILNLEFTLVKSMQFLEIPTHLLLTLLTLTENSTSML